MHSGKQIKPLTLFNEFYDEDTGQTDRHRRTPNRCVDVSIIALDLSRIVHPPTERATRP